MATEIIWGFAGPWYGEYRCWDGDETMNRLRFLVDHGFRSTGLDLREMRDAARGERIAAYVAEHDLRLTVELRLDYFAPDLDVVRRQADAFLAELEAYGGLLRTPIVTTCVGPYHRFMSDPPLTAQMDRLAAVLGPVARACHEMGRPLGLENHGDYYCDDLAALCRRTPHLGIFLDTGNTFLAGERPLPAYEAAAPHVIGTHFKDHYVRPDPAALSFVLDGAPLGAGHAELAAAWRILREKAPADRPLVMQWEMVTPKGLDPLVCLEESWKFVRNLPGGGAA